MNQSKKLRDLENYGAWVDSRDTYPEHDFDCEVAMLVGDQDTESLSIGVDDGGYISIPFENEDEDKLFQFYGTEHHSYKIESEFRAEKSRLHYEEIERESRVDKMSALSRYEAFFNRDK